MEQIQYLIPAAVIVNSQNQILFIKKSQARSEICINRWELPGGTIKFGETFEESLKRKIKEYLGIEINVDKIIPQVSTHTENSMQFFVIGAICHIDETAQINPKPDKISDYKWMRLEEFTDLPEDQRVPGDLEILKSLKQF